MARELWLLRHGEAEPHDARDDFERRLTSRGELQSRAAGRALAALGVSPVAVLASPRVRAWDTARLACEALGVEPSVHRPLGGPFEAGEARELALGCDDGEAIVLVGHEPSLSGVVGDLAGGRVELKKGGVALLRFKRTQVQLAVLVGPAELAVMAQGADVSSGIAG